MQPDQRHLISDLYHQAFGRPTVERDRFLREACGGDDELRVHVESLLRYDARAADFLERPAGTAAPIGASMIGRHLGPYHLLAPLGAGGMGEVYRAHDTKLGRERAERPGSGQAGVKRGSDAIRQGRSPLLSGAQSPDVTALLIDWRGGNAQAMQELVPLVHDELRRIARRHMAGERPGHVLQATALVNEVYLRLIDIRRVQWQDRAHFFATAARLMRRVLVDAARAEKNQKRGGALHRVTLDPNMPVRSESPDDLIAIDAALQALAAEHERKARVVELRFFGGLDVKETADVLNISEETVTRDWKFAKVWLMRELSRSRAGTGETRTGQAP